MQKDTQNTALLVMDMEAGILGNFPDPSAFTNNVAKAIDAARNSGIPVIYVIVGFRQGAPEASMNNKTFAANNNRFTDANMDEFMKIHKDIAPKPGEIVVTKRRISAFTGSDLEVVLRAKGIQHLVLTGVATSGVVLSTTREAADKDFRITILSDGCLDADEEVHRVLTTKVFIKQADVLTIAEWIRE